MNKFIFMITVVVAMVVTACKKDQYYLYNDVARIQFGPATDLIYDPASNLADTLKSITFFYDPPQVTEDTVFFDIYAIGGTAKIDRSFTLEQEQVRNVSNAVPGTHYVPFTEARAKKNYVIKAGTVHTKVPVIVLRDPSLKTTTFTLKFNVVADDNFKIGEAKNLWRKVLIIDRLSQPAAWNINIVNTLGKYSVTKHKFMIDVTGYTWDEKFSASAFADFSIVQYYQAVFQTALLDYNNAHPGAPLTDESGDLVVFRKP